MTIYVGIDPGLNGAVAAIDEKGCVLFLQDTPIVFVVRGARRRHEYCEPDMARQLRFIAQSANGDGVLVTVENVHARPKQGVVSSFSFGVGYGIWRGIIAALALPCDRVEPTVWKRAVGLAKSDKGAAVSLAHRRFPTAAICDLVRGRVRYRDGRAEALLIAEFARHGSRLSSK
jgi:crossover junction endodeoxyribonuclease RuvC